MFLSRSRLGVAVVAACSAMAAKPAIADSYMGADVSLLPFIQQQGVVFKQNGVAEPADQILYDAGANLFRLRLFVNPQTTYTNTNVGAIQTLSYDIALAQQLKADAPNAKLLLDLQYSDTWADPAQQTVPAAWSGQTLTQLQSTIQTYTDNTLLSFKAAGVMPSMVQIGNEINDGILWPSGSINFNGSTSTQEASWAAFGSLVNSAIAGVREAQGTGPAVNIALHIANGDIPGEPQYFFQQLSSPSYGNVNPSSYDTMGVSFLSHRCHGHGNAASQSHFARGDLRQENNGIGNRCTLGEHVHGQRSRICRYTRRPAAIYERSARPGRQSPGRRR